MCARDPHTLLLLGTVPCGANAQASAVRTSAHRSSSAAEIAALLMLSCISTASAIIGGRLSLTKMA